MKRKKIIVALFLSIVFVVVGAPVTTVRSGLELKTASAQVTPICSKNKLDPITDLTLIHTTAPRPEGAKYACAVPNAVGGGIAYEFFNDNNQLLGGINKPNDLSTSFDTSTLITDAKNNVTARVKTPTSCNFEKDWSSFFSPTCWFRFLGAVFTSVFVFIGVKTLEIAGLLFNSLLDLTVVSFKTKIYDLIKDAVETGWTAFRDIANILIIGIFTFIALSIILGLKEYGQKKLIAKVLIIAVLINFSLLFTKMIIDVSNFTAIQFYNASLGQVTPTDKNAQTIAISAAAIGNSQALTAESKGISGQFMQYIGITGFGNSLEQIRKTQETQDSGLLGILFGLLSLTYLLAVAIVLFYGCFLLVSRAILLIFLMISSSVAFASYLVPSWETSSYGWKAWWGSLIRCAVFAPILMLLLWITLLLAKGLASKSGSIGDLATKPGEGIAAFFSYIMILGMLFLSFKLSSLFASKIAGFNFASIATALPFTLGSRLTGLGLRAIGVGGLGYSYQKRMEEQAREARDRAAALRGAGRDKEARKFEQLAATKLKRAGRGASFADSKFNLMNTAGAKAVLGAAGISGFAAGASGGGAKSYADRVKADAESAEKRARAITVSGDDESKIRAGEAKEEKERREEIRAKKTVDKENADKIVKGIHEAATDQKKAFETSLKAATDTISKHQDDAVKSEEKYAEALKNVVEKGGGADEIAKVKAGRESELLGEKAHIEKAKQEAEGHRVSIAEVDKRFAPEREKKEKELKKLEDEIKNLHEDSQETKNAIRNVADDRIAKLKSTAQDIAGEVGRRKGLIRTTAQRNHVAEEVRSKFKSNVGSAGIRQALEEYVKKDGGGGGGVKTEDKGGGKDAGH